MCIYREIYYKMNIIYRATQRLRETDCNVDFVAAEFATSDAFMYKIKLLWLS